MVDWDYYTNPFYMKLKIPIDMKISNVEKKWGKALDVTYVDDGEKSPIYIYRYDGFYIMSEAAIAKGAEPRIMVVVVDSDKYKFTYKHLGLGSPKSDVEKWGKHKMKLLDTEPNELGYILGYSYVIFTIDENDCVKEISFTSWDLIDKHIKKYNLWNITIKIGKE